MTAMIPFDQCVVFIGSLNCAEFSSQFAEVAATFDAISGNQWLIVGRWFGKRWLPGTISVSGRSGV
jgi:hypothetical protein